MDGMTLLAEGRQAGLKVQRAGDRLIVRGPQSYEGLARRLLGQKDEILALLREEEKQLLVPDEGTARLSEVDVSAPQAESAVEVAGPAGCQLPPEADTWVRSRRQATRPRWSLDSVHRCYACGTERVLKERVCPVCHPPARP